MDQNNKLDKKGEPGTVTKPFKYKTVPDLKRVVDAYFADTNNKPYSLTELAMKLGTTRLVLRDYAGRNGYDAVIREALAIIESQTEKMLTNGGTVRPAGPIFVLCNNFKGWQQKQETNSNVNVSGSIGISLNWIGSDRT